MGTSVILLGDVPTAPPLKLKEDHSHIMYWSQEDFNCAESKQVSGETSGDVSTNNTVSPQEPQDNYTKYYYLQHDDGTHISKKEVAHLSFDACAHWFTLLEQKQAPSTFSRLLGSAWESFSRSILSDPNHAFLHWCKDREWKLQEWCTQNYSSWALNTGLWQKKPKKPKTKGSNNNILDDTKLIHMQDNEGDDKANNADIFKNILNDNNCSPDIPTQKGDKGKTLCPLQTQMQSVLNPSLLSHMICFDSISGIMPPHTSNLAIQGSIVMYPFISSCLTLTEFSVHLMSSPRHHQLSVFP